MTAMLASVRNLAEAELAFSNGVDWLDLKEPADGALGAVAPNHVDDIVRTFGGRIPISATIGDCWASPELIVPKVAALARLQVDYVKIGIFLDQWSEGLVAAFHAAHAIMPRLIAVCFADSLSPAHAARVRTLPVCGAMLDTADKQRGSLLSITDENSIAAFLSAARASGFITGLAGSLTASDVPLLLKSNPDYLGFRGALCRQHDRVDALDALAIQRIRKLIPTPSDRLNASKGAMYGMA